MMHSFGSMAEMKREERHHLPPTYDHQRGKKDDGERATNDNIILQENNKRRNVPSYSYYSSRNILLCNNSHSWFVIHDFLCVILYLPIF